MRVQLLTKDMTLVAAMSIVCPSHEVDELTISLLTIFEHRGRTFELIETLIKQEIEQTGRLLQVSVEKTFAQLFCDQITSLRS